MLSGLAMAHVRGILTLQVPELKVRGTLKVEDLHLPIRSFEKTLPNREECEQTGDVYIM